MAGLKWIRIDTQMFENPKLLYLKEDKQFRAIVVHLEGMAYSGRHALAGFIPKAALRVLGAVATDANRLVKAGLWDLAPGGWQIHDWDDYQLSADDMAKRRDRAQKGAAARWKRDDERGGNVVNLNA
ncbi:hypothetical protein [Mycolicibacterium sp.]|uniref:hypothetical protein n=1 Tax=Mycolicibacterium sp. TaxID=2320850 RepID=UPI0028B20186|nr:hypothetical protein [Mycolicibacterium sp.]